MKPKILFIFTEWNVNRSRRENNLYGGVGYYRIVKPAQYLRKWYDIDIMGKELGDLGKTAEDVWGKVFETYDLVFTKHTDNGAAASNMLAVAQYYGKPVVIDMDDNFLAIRADNPAIEAYDVGKKEKYVLSALLSMADGLVVSTEPLKTAYSHINKNIDVVPNCNDFKDWNFLPKQYSDNKVRIGYAGSITHDSDFSLVMPALKEVLRKYPHAELEVLGAFSKEKGNEIRHKMRSVKGKLSFHMGTPAWLGYPERLAEMGWDIGIAPLIDDEFNRGKSHIKWFEYSMYKWPTVASKVYPYFEDIQGTKTIQHGKTGFLCETTEDWVKYLSKLIEDESLRKTMGETAYQTIKADWQWASHIQKWKTIIDKYLK